MPAQLLLLSVWSDQWLNGEGMYLAGALLVVKEDCVYRNRSWGVFERCRWSTASVSLRFDDLHIHDGNVANASNAQDACAENTWSKDVRTWG